MKLSTSAFCIVFIAVIAFLAVPSATDAFAQLETTCVFDSATQSIHWTVTGPDVEAVYYFVHPVGSGCTEPEFDIDSVMGPVVAGDIPLNCLPHEGQGCGTIEIPICEEENCFVNYEFTFKCGPECIISEKEECLPSITEWGMLVLLTLLVITGAYLIRRKRAIANR